jgi:hypothetical protein
MQLWSVLRAGSDSMGANLASGSMVGSTGAARRQGDGTMIGAIVGFVCVLYLLSTIHPVLGTVFVLASISMWAAGALVRMARPRPRRVKVVIRRGR